MKAKSLLIFILLFFAILAFNTKSCEAQVVNGYVLRTITPSDTITHEVRLQNVLVSTSYIYDIGVYILSSTTGNIKFAVAPSGLTYPIRSVANQYLAEEKFWIRLSNGYSLYYKSSATSGNSFTLNY